MTVTSHDPTAQLVHQASPDAQWWRSAVIYQIYPRSFGDGDGDGMGDLPGITERLDSLAELGVDAVWLSPFYRSPQHDGGYDVADYRDVDPRFGTLADADALIARAHQLGLRVIVDLVPNHTSDEHAWFRQALADGPSSPARSRYMFREGNGEYGEEPPNNWQSVFGGNAWTRVCDRPDAPGSSWERDGQWYLHLFDTSQPDLNWDSAEVHDEFRSILRFWLDRGVDGFRVDVAHGLVKDETMPDWHERAVMAGSEGDADHNLGPMWDQDGVHEIYREWREVLDEYDDRILVAEAWVEPLERLARYVRHDEMHQAFNFDFLVTRWQAPALRESIAGSYAANDAVGAPTTWVLSNHDVVRHASRLGLSETGKGPNGIGAEDPQPDAELGLRRALAATLLMLALPGSAYVYQGEELGLPEHTTLDDSLRQDPAWWRTGHAEKGRDGCRVPLPWVGDAPAFGFSPTGASWLPQPDSWAHLARDVQERDPDSSLNLYRRALELREQLGLGTGSLEMLSLGEDVVAVRNTTQGRSAVVVITNLGDAPAPLPGGEVLLASGPLTGEGLPRDTTVWLQV